MRTRAERGFVLVAVLWAVALLAFLFATVTGTASRETRLATGLESEAALRATAEGCVHRAIFDLLRGTLVADGSHHRQVLAHATADVVAETESGKLNPNTIPPEVLASLIRVVGGNQTSIDGLVAAILAWRGATEGDPGARLAPYRAAQRPFGPLGTPLRSVGELGLVLGMSPGLLATLSPHLSVYQNRAIDAVHADPVVRAAIAAVGIKPPPPDASGVDQLQVVTITVGAMNRLQAVVRIRATVRLNRSDPTRPVTILRWSEPAVED